jgi:hypothetical protein
MIVMVVVEVDVLDAVKKIKYIIYYMEIFRIHEKFCQRFKTKKNPTYKKIILKNKQKFIGKLTVQYLAMRYFIDHLCFANDYIDFVIFDDFPYLKSVDDESTLFLLKLNKIYEMKKNNMFFIPITSEKYKNDKACVIFNENANLENLILYAFLMSIIKYKNNYKNIYITDKDKYIMDSIMFAHEYLFEKQENRWKIFNGYLRNNIIDSVIKDAGKNLTRDNYEKSMDNYFNKLKKNDPKYLPTMEKEFDLLFNAFLDKIKSIQKTAEYKKFHAECMKTVAPYVFPMKKYFGKDRNIQYECFNQLVEEFEKDYLGASALPP